MLFYLKIYKKSTKYILLTSIGVLISLIGYLIYVLNPLQLALDKLLTLEAGSYVFGLWSEPPQEVLAKMYIFNVTNSEQFLAGKEKLNFSETGPFVYQEILRNTEATFNENGTLTFKPKRELVFRRDYSAEDPDSSIIITPNIPLLGISSYVKDNYGRWINFGFSSVVNMMNSPPMKNLTVTEYLFGYDDPLVELASTYIPSWIDFSKFGIIDRLMALDNGNNTVTIHLHQKNATNPNNLPYSINRFNGSPGLKQWGFDEEDESENSVCNTIEGAFDSGLFPRFLKENTTLRLYRRAFCRAVTFKYEGTDYTSNNLKYYNYRIDQNFLSTTEENPNNDCFCKNTGDCMPKGFGAIAPCYYGIPIAMSQPHYLNGDEEIRRQVHGLNPDKEKHDTVMKVSPDFGIPLSARLRIQINLRVSPHQHVRNAKHYEGLMIPLFWVELGIYEFPTSIDILLFLGNSVDTIEVAVALIFGLVGGVLILTATFCVFRISSQRKLEDSRNYLEELNPILMFPLQAVQISTELKKSKKNGSLDTKTDF